MVGSLMLFFFLIRYDVFSLSLSSLTSLGCYLASLWRLHLVCICFGYSYGPLHDIDRESEDDNITYFYTDSQFTVIHKWSY